MNDSVLRGFCGCNYLVEYNLEKKKWTISGILYGHDYVFNPNCHHERATVFLSPNQIAKINESVEFATWSNDEQDVASLIHLLEVNPFLTAQILSKVSDSNAKTLTKVSKGAEK